MLKGEYESDTLFVLIDKGFECFRGLPNQKKGMQYIITGDLLNEKNLPDTRISHSYFGRMMVLHLCSENILYVDGDHAIGNITKNKQCSKSIKYKVRHVLMSDENYYNWVYARMKLPKLKTVLQSMSIEKLERKLHSRSLI